MFELRHIIIVVLLAALACACATSCADERLEQQSSERLVASVNGQPITQAEFEARFAASRSSLMVQSDDSLSELRLRLAFLDHLTSAELVRQEAQRLGISIPDQEVDAALDQLSSQYPEGEFEATLLGRGVSLDELRRSLRDRLLTERMVQQVVEPTIKVESADVEALYNARIEQYTRPRSAHVLQIVVKKEEQAREVSAQLQTQVEFADLARAKSIAPEAGQGGDLGWVEPGQLPEQMDLAIWDMQPGEVSETIATSYGFHVFKVLQLRPASVIELERVRPQIERELAEGLVDEAWEVYVDQLRAKAHITINESLLSAGTGAK